MQLSAQIRAAKLQNRECGSLSSRNAVTIARTSKLPVAPKGRRSSTVSARTTSSAGKKQSGTKSDTMFTSDRIYDQWLGLPLQPGKYRRTVRRQIASGIWVFEQTQGVLEVIVNIRMTVVKLRDGSLFVHAPVAPTKECIRLVEELGCPVKYIVLPTSAVEHKVFFGPFAKKFPDAELYAVPGQWSFPLNLPLSFLGLFPRKLDGSLSNEGLTNGEAAPWAAEIDQAVLSTPLGIGPYVEAAFFHRASKTLLVTDTVVSVPTEPPEVCVADPKPLLVRAKPRSVSPEEENNAEVRRRGWWKTILFALFFQPAAVDFNPLNGFTWNEGWEGAFLRLSRPRLLVPPILQILVLSKRKQAVQDWVKRVSGWGFNQIIPAHLEAPIKAGPREFKDAFSFLQNKGGAAPAGAAGNGAMQLGGLSLPFLALPALAPANEVSPFGDKDTTLLRGINSFLLSTGTITED